MRGTGGTGCGQARRAVTRRLISRDLGHPAEETGGKSFYVSAGGLDTIFAQVSEDLRTQYFLAYYPRNQEPGTNFHRIRVTLPKATTDSYELRYRTGYYADSPIQ
jgi:Ca-activated chloride channel homolog